MFGNKQAREVDVKETPVRMPERTPERPAAEPMDQKTGSVFARGTRMNGTLRCEGSVRIDGEFEGNLETGDALVVGKEGVVRANVKVKRAIIGGRLEGNIHATSKVELHSGCEVLGEVETPSLVIEEGVVFEGTCKMGSKGQGARRDVPGGVREAAVTTMSTNPQAPGAPRPPSLAQKL
jgi:cytoskeletal protein CcmA (bactofilin family)